MQVKCTRCGKKRTVVPNNLRKHGTTEKTYRCAECQRKTHLVSKNPDWTGYRKLLEMSVLRINDANKRNKRIDLGSGDV
jgi:DNA-directed RNA polymerase subunit RPC12/RpoP